MSGMDEWQKLQNEKIALMGTIEDSVSRMKQENEALADALRVSTTMLEALLTQLHSWGHESAVNASDRVFKNEELLAEIEASGLSPDLKASQRPTVSSETNLTRPPSQPGREVPNDDEVEKAILKFARDHSRVFPLTYESGPYEITKATSRAMDFARAILALTSGTDPGAVTGEPVYCTRDGADFCNAVSDKARCSICPAFPSRNSTDE